MGGVRRPGSPVSPAPTYSCDLRPVTSTLWASVLHLPCGQSDTCHSSKSTSQAFGETEKDSRWTSASKLQHCENKGGVATFLRFEAVITLQTFWSSHCQISKCDRSEISFLKREIRMNMVISLAFIFAK